MDILREIILRDVESTKGASKITKFDLTLMKRLLSTIPFDVMRSKNASKVLSYSACWKRLLRNQSAWFDLGCRDPGGMPEFGEVHFKFVVRKQ